MNPVSEIGILFGDVAGSTRLYDVYGDRAALAAVDACLRLMTAAVHEHGGAVVKTMGDEIMGVLPDSAATVGAARAMQCRIADMPPLVGPQGETRLALRVGFQVGPALEEGGDYFGDTVNLAARMVGIAQGGQIITTMETIDLLPASGRGDVRIVDRLPVKGKADAVIVVEVLWQDGEEVTRIQRSLRHDVGGIARPLSLTLRDATQQRTFDDAANAISLGRDAGSDVLVTDPQASRRHATIERRRDKWVLIDHSTNGTFVTFANEPELELRREEVILRGAGRISFGHPFAERETANALTFMLD